MDSIGLSVKLATSCALILSLGACQRSGESGDDFAAMQSRGAQVMGVDQYTSAHVFEDLPDGGRVVLDRADASDTAAIRSRSRRFTSFSRFSDRRIERPLTIPRHTRAAKPLFTRQPSLRT